LFLKDEIEMHDCEEINEEMCDKYEEIMNEMEKEIHDITDAKQIKINNTWLMKTGYIGKTAQM
jgi:hypothetical protein